MLAISENITRLNADAQFAPLKALERLGESVAEEKDIGPDDLMKALLDWDANEELRSGDDRLTRAK